MAKMPQHTSMPAFGTVHAGLAGHLRVQHYRTAAEEPNTWSVLAPEGRLLGDVTMPHGLRITDIGTDYVSASGATNSMSSACGCTGSPATGSSRPRPDLRVA